MRYKKYIVSLTNYERKQLEEVISSKICNKEKRLRAYMLLKSDKLQDWPDDKIQEAYGVSLSAIGRLRKRFVEEGFERALYRKERVNPPRPRKIQGKEEAHLIALCCSDAPEGRSTWTLQLLADKMVELKVVDAVGRECVRKALKKMNLSLG
jgi:transposase